MYSKSGLEEGIRNSKRNIQSLEKAIENERKRIADYKIMIADIEKSEEQTAEAEKNISVEVVRDDSSG